MTAIQIYKNTGVWKDYVTGSQFMPFKFLVAQTSGSENKNLEQLLDEIEESKTEDSAVEKLKMERTMDASIIDSLLPHYDFYLQKGIHEYVLKHFKSGISTGGKMYQRYVFPIINEQGDVHGLSGRDLSVKTGTDRPKWKHVGRTSNWVYPLYLQGNDGSCPTRAAIEKSGEIILVESIGDCVSLYNEDFQNCLVTFGLTISSKLICALTELSPSKIYLSFNNDRGSAENRGLIAAIKNYCKLLRYFDHSKLQICLPNKKDFGDMNQEDFCEWKKKSESINQDDLIKHIKKQADILYESRKLSANLYKNLKVLPL